MQQTRRICVLGDSIVWGAFDEERGGWVDRLQRRLNADRFTTEVYGLGVCGEGVAGVAMRIETECLMRRPTDIIVATGINDASYFDRPTIGFDARFAEQYELIIRSTYEWRRAGGRTLFLGLTPIDERFTHPMRAMKNLHYTMDSVRRIDGYIWRKTQEFEVPHLPLLEALDITTDLADGLHPNAQGHAKIADLVYAALR